MASSVESSSSLLLLSGCEGLARYGGGEGGITSGKRLREELRTYSASTSQRKTKPHQPDELRPKLHRLKGFQSTKYRCYARHLGLAVRCLATIGNLAVRSATRCKLQAREGLGPGEGGARPVLVTFAGNGTRGIGTQVYIHLEDIDLPKF
jgi:hypothetical protein